ncbi:MAG TPA: BTAD domain-containing putative transcriptional regulator [Longimicrobiaceae bacterium]|nr:BTAD domain-containing putative transcriptional regulator [Longimicrobiaceae bacterium]
MIHLRVLGSTELHDPDGTELRALLAQPKRFAVLAYLALARPRGPQRRELLLARFWPDSDAERGRGALRLALHSLRKVVGEGVLVGRGDEGVGIAPGTLWCDAVEFERALDEGRPADALELYRGELLAGFHLANAPEWERWLERERARLALRAREAVNALVQAAEARDDLDEAVRWARRGADLAPDDEAALQRLLVLLDANGDSAAAIRAYEGFARQLHAAGDGEPLPETQSLAQAIRRRVAARPAPRLHAAPSPASSPQGRTSDAPAALPLEGGGTAVAASPVIAVDEEQAKDARLAITVAGPARPSIGGREKPRRWRRWMAGGIVAAGIAAAAVLGWRMNQPVTPPPGDRVAVMPFRVRGAPQAAYLGEGLVDLLSTRLDGAGEMHTVDPVALIGYATRQRLSPGDLDDGRAAARHFQAGSFVVGDVVEAGGRIQVTASLYDVEGRRRATSGTATGTERELFDVVDRLAMGLLARGQSGPDQRLAQTAALTTRSLPALRSYLTGERWFRAGKFVLAAEAFTEASEADSTFALALYRLSTALDWAGLPYGSRSPGDVVRQALRFRGRLTAHDRMLLDARDAYWNGSAARAEQLYRTVLAAYPTDVEAWHELGEVTFHRGVWMGVPIVRSRAAFERVLALAPENENARIHLARIAALEGRGAERDSLVSEVVRRYPSHARAVELLGLHAFGSGNAAAADSVDERLRGMPYDAFWVNAWRIAIFTGDPAAGQRMAALLDDPDRSPRARTVARTMGAHMLAAQGRFRAASDALAAAAALDPSYAAHVRANLALLPAFPLSETELDEVRGELLRTPVPAHDSAADPIGNSRRYCPTLCGEYVLGALAVRAGDTAAALRSVRLLEKARKNAAHPRELARYQAFALRARLAWRSGDAKRALELLERGWPERTLPQFSSYETYAHTPERMLRADLLRALGRDREALAWYATAAEDLGAGIAYLAPAELAQAEILDRRGDRPGAADHYRRFVALWRDADPEALPAVRRARARLAQLGG